MENQIESELEVGRVKKYIQGYGSRRGQGWSCLQMRFQLHRVDCKDS